jgi:hypothetical protein
MVQLNATGMSFAYDKNKPEILLFNLSNPDPAADWTITNINPGNLSGEFSATGLSGSPVAAPGTFDYAIVCDSGCDFGTGNPLTSISFSVAGATLADLYATHGNGNNPVYSYFNANLVADGDGSGKGSYVGAEMTSHYVDPDPYHVPEPSTWALMLIGALGIGSLACRNKGKAAPRFV